jgi:RNA polymerase sigma-70 factor, ECF subfamily
MKDRLVRAHTELLIIRIHKGETEAFNDLVEMWERRLFYFVQRIVQREEDAWDVLQETWVKVNGGIRHLKDLSTFPAWVYQIARNTAISHLR